MFEHDGQRYEATIPHEIRGSKASTNKVKRHLDLIEAIKSRVDESYGQSAKDTLQMNRHSFQIRQLLANNQKYQLPRQELMFKENNFARGGIGPNQDIT